MQLERMIITGLTRKLKTAFHLTQEPAFISTNDRWRLVDRLRVQDGRPKLELPAAFLRLTQLELNTDHFNTQALSAVGVYAAHRPGDHTVTKYTLLPATYTFELTHLCQDFWDQLSFARRFLLTHRNRGELGFTLDYDGTGIDIRVMCDPQVTTPEKDASIDVPGLYETLCNIQVTGYCSYDLDEAPQVMLVRQIAPTLKDGQGHDL